jgi:hypothetical protein
MNTEEAEKLVAEGKARWFREPAAATEFAKEVGGQYVGKVNRVAIARHLVVLAPKA